MHMNMKIILLLTAIICIKFCRSAILREETATSIESNLKIQREEPDMIEGDIIVDSRLKRVVEMAVEDKNNKHVRRRRDAISYHQKRWKDGIVPYVIDPSVGRKARHVIAIAFYKFHRSTCLWFTPRRNETDYIRIVKGQGCYSAVGRQGGEQLISIGNGCVHTRTVMHELMHSIGFFHENSRNDRDYFVKVLWWNIQHGAEKNFATYTHGVQDTLRMPYDKHSLMHYGNKEFTKNYADTLQDIENPDESLGGRTLSKIDTKQILMLYKCKKPRYKVRQDKCKDKLKTGCMLFSVYPHLCNFHVRYILRNCQRTCRVCEVEHFSNSN